MKTESSFFAETSTGDDDWPRNFLNLWNRKEKKEKKRKNKRTGMLLIVVKPATF